MKTTTSISAALGLLLLGLASARADVFVIVKHNVAGNWTDYQVDDPAGPTPYGHAPEAGSESHSAYEIVNITTQDSQWVFFDTFYDRGTALKRYRVDSVMQSNPGSVSPFQYYRAGGADAAPTYRYVSEYSDSTSSGGPDDLTTPTATFERNQELYYVTAGPLPLTTIVPGTAVLAPINAKGVDQAYNYTLSYPSATLGTPAAMLTVEFASGVATENYDSVLTASANAASPAASSLTDYDGTPLTARTMAYAVKLVRDALEKIGYEKDSPN